MDIRRLTLDEIPERFQLPAPDRGVWTQEHLRARAKRPTLVMGGRKAGKSRVVYFSPNLELILFRRDFFISMLEFKVHVLVTVVFLLYIVLTFFWSAFYYLIMKYEAGCLYGATTFVEVWIYSFITMATIGYGNTGPQQCWSASTLVSLQGTVGLLLDAVVLGIIFSRISHPKQRSRSIFISDSAVISRRDGILKFMFRVADVRKTQVVDPKIKAYLYTWGEGRITAEGERVPVRVEELDIGYIDGMLILPLTIEHTIDEVSPLWGHTHDSLVAMTAEIVITFEGTTEFGNPFMARRSYVPSDIDGNTRYTIDLDAFHEVTPQPGLPPLPRAALSRLVVNRAKRTVPYPLLGHNTLVLSDAMCLFTDERGRRCLAARVADTYPNQVIEVTAKMHLYRWREPGADPPFECVPLECGYRTGADRIYLRLPIELVHICVLITGYLFINGHNVLRQRTYSVVDNVRVNHRFVPIVKHPDLQPDKLPSVRWGKFHDTALVNPRLRDMRQNSAMEPVLERLQTGLRSADPGERAAAMAALSKISPSSLEVGNDFTVANIDLARQVDKEGYAAMVAAAGDNTVTEGAEAGAFPPIPDFDEIIRDDPEGREIARMLPHIAHYALTTTDVADSLPHPGSLRPMLPGPSHFGGRIMDDRDDEDDSDEAWMQARRARLGGRVLGADKDASSFSTAETEDEDEDEGETSGSNNVHDQTKSQPQLTDASAVESETFDSLGGVLRRYTPDFDGREEDALLPSGLPADAVGVLPPQEEQGEQEEEEEGSSSDASPSRTSESPSARTQDASQSTLIRPSPVASEPEHLEDEEAVESPTGQAQAAARLSPARRAQARSSSDAEEGESVLEDAELEGAPATEQGRRDSADSGPGSAAADEEEADANEEANEGPIHLGTATSWAQHRALTNLFAPPSEDEEVPEKEASQTPPRGGRTPD
ncbi:hypothetical protein QBZ16_002456 [Prototheca wickerhamii]|uniref:Uncharacterized protein n=1 Tax=Prototheca wickerhamii TaxID=3111 RepID=A0AAD9INF1_PROWI|nr:hypothetical protein QBZ16_002456 [Prototheca wickerhamii]